MSRTSVAVLTSLAVLAIAAPVASAAGPKPKRSGTPITVTVLPGSALTIARPDGTTGTAALSGALRGVIAGGYKLSGTNTITLTTGHLDVAPAPLAADGCSTAPLTTSALSTLGLRPGAGDRITIDRTGVVGLSLASTLRLVLDVRTGACGAGIAPSDAADTPMVLAAGGRVVRDTGLSHLVLDGPAAGVQLAGCVVPGAPTTACAAPTALPATVTPHLELGVRIG